MTNSQLIMQSRIYLMEKGIIKATDQKLTYTDDEGVHEISLPEEIKTFKAWKDAGRIVQKGQHAVAKIQIWMPRKDRRSEEVVEASDGDDSDEAMQRKGFYKKVAFFFTIDQTKEIGA